MKRTYLLAVFAIACHCASAQVEAPFSFTSEDDNRLIKASDTGSYYAAGNEDSTADTTNIVWLNDETGDYKLLTADYKIIAEGKYKTVGDKYLRDGKWTEYAQDGKVKNTGYYYAGNPIGTWQRYYANGRLKCICNYAIIEKSTIYSCLSGNYQEFYENGKLKTSGFYKAVIDNNNKDTFYTTDPVTMEQERIVASGKPRSEKFGTWETYNELGALIKKDDY